LADLRRLGCVGWGIWGRGENHRRIKEEIWGSVAKFHQSEYLLHLIKTCSKTAEMECPSVSLALQRKRCKASSLIENGNKDRVRVHYNKPQLPPSILPTKQQRGGTRVSFRSEEAWQ